jgi:Flp pilus assembly protein TadG
VKVCGGIVRTTMGRLHGQAMIILRHFSHSVALQVAREEPHFVGQQAYGVRYRGNDGNAILEFALILPTLLMVITGVWQFGVLYNHYILLTQATTAGAQTLQTDRLSTANDPCADTFTAIANAAPTLDPTKIGITITMNNNTAITSKTCSGKQTQLAMGGPVTVQATYPYSLNIAGITIGSGSMSSWAISEISY